MKEKLNKNIISFMYFNIIRSVLAIAVKGKVSSEILSEVLTGDIQYLRTYIGCPRRKKSILQENIKHYE